MQKNIIIATANPHKLEEMRAINTFDDVVFSSVDVNFSPEESGSTFKENAKIKAQAAAKVMEMPSLADDSGLCVDVLDGAPGLYSARFAGSQSDKISKLLDMLKSYSLEQKTAQFICSMVLVDAYGEVLHSTEGRVNGLIIETPLGVEGFGYDPIFFVPEHNQTMAQLPSAIKNKISHRANALLPMLEWIKSNL